MPCVPAGEEDKGRGGYSQHVPGGAQVNDGGAAGFAPPCIQGDAPQQLCSGRGDPQVVPPRHATVGQKSCSGMDGVGLITSCWLGDTEAPGDTPCQAGDRAGTESCGCGCAAPPSTPPLLGEAALRRGAGNWGKEEAVRSARLSRTRRIRFALPIFPRNGSKPPHEAPLPSGSGGG